MNIDINAEREEKDRILCNDLCLIRCRKNVFIPDADRGEFIEIAIPVFIITYLKRNVLFYNEPHQDVFKEEIGDEKSRIIAQFKKIGLVSENIKYLVNSNLYFERAVDNQFLTKVSFLVSKRDV